MVSKYLILIIVFLNCLNLFQISFAQTCSDNWDNFVVKDGSNTLFSVAKSSGLTTIKSLRVGTKNRDFEREIDAQTAQIAALQTELNALKTTVNTLVSQMAQKAKVIRRVRSTDTATTNPTIGCVAFRNAVLIGCSNTMTAPSGGSKSAVQSNHPQKCLCTAKNSNQADVNVPAGACVATCLDFEPSFDE
mmetsp:Transcript_15519/g.26725  ORF Transcript_15519/g.26725 Transcript_15519/m.26725 type:complete len:190 (-) Transcript_15519:43-612(-)